MKKGKRISFTICLLAVLFLVSSAHALLYNRGTDINGNRLIYDSDFNITWYDYTKSAADWSTQNGWAGALDVDFGGTHYTDWAFANSSGIRMVLDDVQDITAQTARWGICILQS